MIYKTCPICGAHLDPGEWCDCSQEEPEREMAQPRTAKPQKRNREIPAWQDAYVARRWRSYYEN